ncbi:MAG TPA: IS200/IS605 family transposase [Williamwhitmania sp.]|nr:IS200/IS605 family transposase [Williamwhitmania sp.]
MSVTYTQINVHCIFATNGRENILTADIRQRLNRYVSGIIKSNEMFPLAVNGFVDHLHIFFELPPTASLAHVIQIIKASSSKWMNENHFMPGKFSWQTGYAAFTYSRSQRDGVIQYIMNQEHRHANKTFREEYLEFLKKYEIDFDDRYLFEFYD